MICEFKCFSSVVFKISTLSTITCITTPNTTNIYPLIHYMYVVPLSIHDLPGIISAMSKAIKTSVVRAKLSLMSSYLRGHWIKSPGFP